MDDKHIKAISNMSGKDEDGPLLNFLKWDQLRLKVATCYTIQTGHVIYM